MKRGRRPALVAALVVSSAIGATIWAPPAFADDCYLGVYACNVEAQRSPVVTWPRGVSALFPTIGGTVYISLINSVGVFADDYNLTESGWFLDAGRNRFNPFAVHVFNGVYFEDDAASPAGNFTFQYLTKYNSSGPNWEIEALNSGSTWMDYKYANPSFVTGYAITNAERHSSSDVFSGTPTYTSLQVLSSNTWSAWPAATCFFDDDSAYQGNYYTSPTKVTVSLGGNNC